MSNINSKSIDPFGWLSGAAVQQPELEPPESQQEADLNGRFETLFLAAQAATAQRVLNENLYLASIMGDQWLGLDPASGVVYRVVDSQQSQYVSQNNLMIALHLALWGKLTRTQPDFLVTPGGGSQAELYGARAAERFLEYFRTARNTKQVIDKAKGDATWSTRGGLVELTWDPQGGSDFYHCFTCGFSTEEELDAEVPCPHCEQQQQQYEMQMQQMQMQPGLPGPDGQPPMPPQPPPPPGVLQCLNRGGPCLSDVDPRNVFYQPGCEKWEDVGWYIVRESLPVQTVRAMFPHLALQIYPEADVYPNHGAHWTVDGEFDNYRSEELQDHVYLYRLVEKPSAMFPQGRIVFRANNRILGETEGYFKYFGRLPLFRFGWIPVRGTPYYRPPAADAWHRQRELNRLETQMSEHTSISSKPKTIIPYGSRIAVDELTSQSNQILMPTLATANLVRYLIPPPLSQDVYNRRELISGDMRMLFAVTLQETAAATDPNGRYAAIAEAESDQTVGPIIRAHNQEEADLMRCLLILVQLFGDPEEKFFGLGDDNQELFMFQDIMFRAKHSNVGILPSDGMSQNLAIRKQEANTMLQLGIFGDPMQGLDKAGYAEAAGLKLRGMSKNMTDTEIQAAHAAIKMLEDGYPFQPKPYDDPAVFANVLLAWLRSNGRRYEQTNLQLVQQVTELMMFYQEQLFMAQQAQAGAGAPPPGPGGASTSSGGQSAPGGSPNNAVPPEGPAGEAEQIKRGADAAAEGAARGAVAHES